MSALLTTRTDPALKKLETYLSRQAQLLLGLIVPGITRLYRPAIHLAEEETASTNGSLWIRMPLDFLGLKIAERSRAAPIWTALLGHELGHWLQPTEAINEKRKQLKLPHSLVNILLDIHGEALVARLFPSLDRPLTRKRAYIGAKMRKKYLQQAKEASEFRGAVQVLALYSRFCNDPHVSYFCYRYDPVTDLNVLSLPPTSIEATGLKRLHECVLYLGSVVMVASKCLPDFLERLAAAYPELVLPEPEDESSNPGGMESGGNSTSSGGSLLPLLRRVLGNALPLDTNHHGIPMQDFAGAAVNVQRPTPQVKEMARRIQPRFFTPRGALAIPAPGRFDRIAAIHGDPLPFRMDIPSRFSGRPCPKLLLAVDMSGSMNNDSKWRKALCAAQAIGLAVQHAGGDVRALVFHDHIYHTPDYSLNGLFAAVLAGQDMSDPSSQDTTVAWLPTIWTLFPQHFVLLLTDGCVTLPVLIPEDARQRTSAIVIPDGDIATIRHVAAQAVEVYDLNHLPGAFAYLTPRQWVA